MYDTDTLIKKALIIFLKKGIKSVNMDDIANSLGISKKTLYLHVDNKSDLVNKSFALHVSHVLNVLEQLIVEGRNSIDELFLIDQKIATIMKQTNPYVLGELRRFYPEAWKVFEEFKHKGLFSILKNNLRKGIAQGLFRPELNIDIISKLMLSRADVLINDEVFPLTTYNFQTLLMENKIYHIRGIATFKGINYLEQKINES